MSISDYYFKSMEEFNRRNQENNIRWEERERRAKEEDARRRQKEIDDRLIGLGSQPIIDLDYSDAFPGLARMGIQRAVRPMKKQNIKDLARVPAAVFKPTSYTPEGIAARDSRVAAYIQATAPSERWDHQMTGGYPGMLRLILGGRGNSTRVRQFEKDNLGDDLGDAQPSAKARLQAYKNQLRETYIVEPWRYYQRVKNYFNR